MSDVKFMAGLVVTFLTLLLVLIINELFNAWVFFGMLFMALMYLFGYLYVVNYYYNKAHDDADVQANKKKLDWCWSRVNEILKKMPGGQGLEWRKGIGRRSEFRTYYDGIQHKPFRSMEGYLASTQLLVVIIYDIDGDDIVKFHSNPDAEVIANHFYEFKPFQQRSTLSGMDRYSRRRPTYSRYGRRRSGVSIHVGDDDYENFDSMPNAQKVDDTVASDALKKLKE